MLGKKSPPGAELNNGRCGEEQLPMWSPTQCFALPGGTLSSHWEVGSSFDPPSSGGKYNHALRQTQQKKCIPLSATKKVW